MTKLKLHCLLAFLLPLAAAAAELFPAFNEIPKQTLMPQRAEITVDTDGNYLVNGKPRHMIGVQFSLPDLSAEFAPTAGYPDSLKWLYEGMLTYQTAQRVGIDAVSFINTMPNWIKELSPDYTAYVYSPKDRQLADQVLGNGLPMQIDNTCTPWSHGLIANRPQLQHLLPPEAINEFRKSNGNHWVPYNIFHPAARDIYRRYWEAGVEEFANCTNPKIVYELFNEPAYNDPSPYNRGLFAGYLAKKYKTPEAMNRVWRSQYDSFDAASRFNTPGENPGLSVDWGKFLEEGFTDLARFGQEVIRAKAPGAATSFQVLGLAHYRMLPMSNVNSYEIQKRMEVISTDTGGGLNLSTEFDRAPERSVEAPGNPGTIGEGMLDRAFFRAVADGKPILNPECYSGTTPTAMTNTIWMDMLRGSSLTYLFGWSKRAWDWKPAGTPEGGKKIAEEFPYLLLDPYARPPETIAAIYRAKQEITRFSDYFVPRQYRAKPEIALLLSYPTERYGAATGNTIKNEIRNYASGLTFAHYPFDAIMEEQLPGKRWKKYRAILAVGTRNTYPDTLPELDNFVRDGGILIAARETMPLDEYGNPVGGLFDGLKLERKDARVQGTVIPGPELPVPASLPGKISGRSDAELSHSADWQVIATQDGAPTVLRRQLGKGMIYLIAPQLQDYAIAAVAGGILRKHGILPAVGIFRIPQNDLALNLEAHVAGRNGNTQVFLLNYDQYPKLAGIELPEGASCAADLSTNRELPRENGRAVFWLGPGQKIVLGFGAKEKLESEFGPLPAVSKEVLTAEYRAAETKLEEERKRKAEESFRYTPNLAQTFTLDLRPFANSGYTDDAAGNGRGGWTDQGGDNVLEGVPWERRILLGVPCEFIRFDQNDNKTCVILNSESVNIERPSEIRGIPVNEKVANLFFFHTAAWVHNDTILTYRIHYASGKSIDVPIVGNRDIGDWWTNQAPESLLRHVAWENMEGRGLYLTRWENPIPEDEIRNIDLVSSDSAAVPIIFGITGERYVPGSKIPVVIRDTTVWGGPKAVIGKDGTLTVSVTDRMKDWGGVRVNFKTPIPVADLAGKVLKFEINGGADLFGNVKGGQRLQMFTDGSREHVPMPRVDNDRNTFEPVVVPAESLLGKSFTAKALGSLSFQYIGLGDSGFEIRNIRFESGEK